MSPDFRLTDNLLLREFYRSASFPVLAEQVPDGYGHNVVRLAALVMQPIRNERGLPIITLSGYRSALLNRKVGGSATSQHLTASALDWRHPLFKDTVETYRALMRVHALDWIDVADSEVPLVHALDRNIGQVILYPTQHFVHIALPSERYPHPTFCVHAPTRGYVYRVVSNVAALDAALNDINDGE